MKKIIFLILVMLTLSANAQKKTAAEILKEYKVNTAFEPGEELIYDLKYGIVKAGEFSIKVGLVPVGYEYCFYAIAKCYTTGLASKLARIYDVYESYFDIVSGLPVKAVRNVTENNYKRYNEDLFFQDSSVVYSMKSGRHKVPENTFDIISAFYFSRKFIFDQKYQKNEYMNLTSWFDEELYKFKMAYKGTEKVKTDYGKIECLKFSPILENDATFKNEDDMVAWFTNDGNFVPVKIIVKLPLGKAKCELKSFKNLKNKDGFLKE
jgi:hypothetical protein